MPAKIQQNEDGSYRVSTPNGVHAKHTSKENAKKQQRLLNAIDHGFVPNKSRQGHLGRNEKHNG